MFALQPIIFLNDINMTSSGWLFSLSMTYKGWDFSPSVTTRGWVTGSNLTKRGWLLKNFRMLKNGRTMKPNSSHLRDGRAFISKVVSLTNLTRKLGLVFWTGSLFNSVNMTHSGWRIIFRMNYRGWETAPNMACRGWETTPSMACKGWETGSNMTCRGWTGAPLLMCLLPIPPSFTPFRLLVTSISTFTAWGRRRRRINYMWRGSSVLMALI